VRVDLVTIIVTDYDPAIDFFVDALGFDLVEDSPSFDQRRTVEALGRRSAAWR